MHRFEGFHEFVLTRGPVLSRLAYLLVGDHQQAEDLLQQALTRTAARWRSVRSNPEGYVRRAMVNERTSWWRRRRFIEVGGDALEGTPAVADQTESVLRRVTLAKALATLPPRQRAAVVLRFYADMTEAQVAEALDCSIGTVKSQTHDALARLRRIAPELLADGDCVEAAPGRDGRSGS